MNTNNINYSRIYTDILKEKYPHKLSELKPTLEKEKLSTIDVIYLNEKIFGTRTRAQNQRLRSYAKSDILKILDYQKKNKLNNTQVSNQFNMSRNTIAKWRGRFLV